MTNFEAMDKDDLAEALSDSGDCCRYCLFYGKNLCGEPGELECFDGIRKWFDEESIYEG